MLTTLDFEGVAAVIGPWFLAFSLALVRMSALFIATPVFATPLIPTPAKIGLTASVAILALSVANPTVALMNLNAADFLICGVQELVVGSVMGIGLSIMFGALSFAGQLVGIQMGFAIANVVDPVSSQQVGVLAQLLNLLGLALFVAFDGHLLVLRALFESFTLVPLAGAQPFGDRIVEVLVSEGSRLFALGLQVALPISCVVLLVNVALATVARTVPQVNVFVLGFLFTIALGLLILMYSLPYTASVLENMLEDAIRTGVSLTRLFGR